MTPEEWGRVKEILDGVLDRDPVDRDAFLAEACGGDAALRRRVEALAGAGEQGWELLDAPDALWSAASLARSGGRSGRRIGAYELLDVLGEGGMGVVYLARRADDEFQKNVAVKLIRPGTASEAALRRFRSERQISASLDHPGIARLLDGGTTEAGEPYFVMEHVEGEPLKDYCRRRGLSVPGRLRLFREICAAVHHAHQNLVVHRDLKPGNILVTPDGAPKLLDFGIAKLLHVGTGEDGGEPTSTLFRILTPEYASPEQVRGRNVTTSSDVYSLGIVLYELLTGDKPYRVATGDPEELVRVVCERDPERPSTRTAGLSSDLDAIVMKAIRKEPERRYASADALSADIGRYLEGRPVLARKGTASYRAGKFVRRNRIAVAAAGLLAAALAGGVLATLRESRRAREAEARAERRFRDVRALANSFLFEFHDAIRDLPGSTEARSLVVRRALEYLDKLSKEAGGDRDLNRELAAAYQRVGEVQGNPYGPNLGDMKGALESYGKSISMLEPLVRAGGAHDEERTLLATAYLVRGGMNLVAGDRGTAVAQSRQGLRLREALAKEQPRDRPRRVALAQAWQYLAFSLAAADEAKQSAEALAHQRRILLELQGSDPRDRAVRRSLAQNAYLRGSALHRAGDHDAALATYGEAEEFLLGLQGEDPGSVADRRAAAYLYLETGNSQAARGDAAAALLEQRKALALFERLASDDPRSTDPILGIAMAHTNAGMALRDLGRLTEALRELRQGVPRYETALAGSESNAWAAGMLGTALIEIADIEVRLSGQSESSCALLRRAAGIFERIAAAGSLAPDRQGDFDRARNAAARCSPR